MKTIFLLALCFVQAFHSFAQPSDCINAIQIVDKSSLYTLIGTDTNEVNDMLFVDKCPEITFNYNFENEIPSYWLTWTIFESGTLIFDISMDLDVYDLDFVVYKSDNPEFLCESLSPIRCMFSGFSVANGQIIPDLPCYQSTGLSFFETDLTEISGCPEGQNGYARYLNVEKGETYVLVILNFTAFEEDIVTIDFCGSALLGPDDFICDQPVTTKDVEKKKVFVSPNPAQEYIRLKNLSLQNKDYTNWTISNLYGAIYKFESISDTEFVADISHLSRGVYIIMYEEDGVPKFEKFFKL